MARGFKTGHIAHGHGVKAFDLEARKAVPAHLDVPSWVGGVFDAGLVVWKRGHDGPRVHLHAPDEVLAAVVAHLDRIEAHAGILQHTNRCVLLIPAAQQYDVLSRVVMWMRTPEKIKAALDVCSYRVMRKRKRGGE